MKSCVDGAVHHINGEFYIGYRGKFDLGRNSCGMTDAVRVLCLMPQFQVLVRWFGEASQFGESILKEPSARVRIVAVGSSLGGEISNPDHSSVATFTIDQ